MSPDPKVGNAGGTVSVKGKVLDAAGSPAANINVPIFKGDTQIAQVTSNSEGVFTAELTNDAVGDVVYKFGVASDYEQGQWTIKWLNPTPISEIEFEGHNVEDAYTTDDIVLVGKAKLNGQPFTGDTMVNFYKNNSFQWGQLVTGGEFRQPIAADENMTTYYCTNVDSSDALGVHSLRWTDPAKMPASFEISPDVPTTHPISTDLYIEVTAKDASGQPMGGITVPWFRNDVDRGDVYIDDSGVFEIRDWTGIESEVVYKFGSPIAPEKQGTHTVNWVDNTPVYSGIVVLPISQTEQSVGKNAEVTVKTVDQFGNPMANQSVSLTIPGEVPSPARLSDNKGECLFLISGDTVGPVTYSFQGHGGEATEHTVTWKAAPTVASVVYSPLSSAKTPIGGDARIMVLVTGTDDKPMSSEEVTFRAGSASGVEIGTAMSNFSGLATMAVPQDGDNLTRTVWAGIGDKGSVFDVTWADGATIGMSISNIDLTSRVEVGQRGMLNVQVRNSLGEFLPSAGLKLYDSETYEEIPCNLTRFDDLGWITADLEGTGSRQFYIVTDSNYSMGMMNWDDKKNISFTGIRINGDAALSMPLNQATQIKGFVSNRWGSPVDLNKLHRVVQVIDGVESPCVVLSTGEFIAHAMGTAEGTQDFTWTLDSMMSESGQYRYIERVVVENLLDICHFNGPSGEYSSVGCIVRDAKDNSLVPHWPVLFIDKATGDDIFRYATDEFGIAHDYVDRPTGETSGTIVFKSPTTTDVEIPWTADETIRGIQFADAMLANTELAHDEKASVTVEMVDLDWEPSKGKLKILIPTTGFLKDCTAEVSNAAQFVGEFGPFPAGNHTIVFVAEAEIISENFTVAEAPSVPIGRVDLDSFNPETGTVGKEVSIYGQIFDAQMSYLPDTKLEWSIDGTPQTPVMSDNQGYFEVLVTGTEVGPTVYAFDPQGVNERCTITWAAGATLGEIELAGGLPSTGTVGTPIKLNGTCWDTELNPMPVQGLPWSIGSVAQTPLNTAQDGTFEVTVNADAAGDVVYSFGEGDLLTSTTVTWNPATPTDTLEFAGVSADRSIGDDYTEATVTLVLKDAEGAGIAGREIKLYNKADMTTALTTMTSVAAGWQQYDIYHNGTGDVTYVAVCGDLRAEHTVTWEAAGTKLAAEFSNTFFDTKVKTGKRSRIRGKVADVDYAPLGRKANLKYFNKKTLEDLDVTVKVNKKGFFDFTVGNFGSGANAVILASEQAQENFSISSANANIDMASASFNASVPRCFRMNDSFKLAGVVYNSDGKKLTATKNQPLNIAWVGNSWDGQMTKNGNWNSTVQFTESGRLVINVSASDNGFLAEHHVTVTEDGRLLNPLPICAYKAVVGEPINMSLLLVDENDAPLASQSITVDLLETSESTLYWNTNDKGICEGQITMNTAGTYIAQFWVNGLTLDIPVTWVETTEKVAKSFSGIETPQTTDYGLGVTLSGKVLDQDGNHLVGAPVVLFDPVAGVAVPKTEVKNDETGFHYIVNSYGAGEHTFIVSSGNARQNMVVTWNKEADVITTLEVTTPNPTIGHLGKTVTVTGAVKNQYGENMVGTAVSLAGANVTLDTTTTETGFTFTVPSEGRVDGDSIWYTIEAGAKSLDYVINWENPPVLTDIGMDPYNRQMLATVAAVELRGRLLDAKGWAYFPDAPVTFELRDGSTVVHTVTTQPDGRWEVTDRGEVEGEFLLTAHVGDKQIGEVHLTRCDNTNRLNPSYLTRLRMMPSKRMPITVLCTNNDGAPSDDGEVEFYLADGDVLIGSGFPSYGECRAWIDAGKLPTVTEPTKVKVYAKYKGGTHRIFFVIEVVPESPLWGVEVSNVSFPTQIPTDETVTVTGNVVNVDGDEVVGARIQLYHLNDMWPLTFDLIKHDANGFELRVPYYYQGRSKVEVQGDEGYVETPAITWK